MIDTTPLHEQIERELRQEILSGRLPPGARLSIDELAQQWQVSSTPVRDAVRMLEWKGFVEVLPRRGVRVVTLDAAALRDLFNIRVALECLAVELAWPHIPLEEIDDTLDQLRHAYHQRQETGERHLLAEVDTTVHDLVLRHCGNSYLTNDVHGLMDLIEWARSYVVRLPHSYEDAYPEHVAILEALRSRDRSRGVEAMCTHLRNALARTLRTD
jgi:DNA-binding GntR family transcriptional regulator